jgi:hypothetical protein
MCREERKTGWVAIYLCQEWIAVGDDSPMEWGSVPYAVETITLGDPVDEQVIPDIWIFENVEPTSEDDPIGGLDDEVPST